MLEELRYLRELQAVDTSLVKMGKLLKEIPLKEKFLEKELAKEEEKARRLRQELADKEKEQRKQELDLKSSEDGVKKFQEQLFACKNNKEYNAIQQEIKTHEGKISASEEKILVLLDELEQKRQELDAEEKIFKEHKERFNKEIAVLRAESRQQQAEREKIAKNRDAVLIKLEADLRGKYERLAKARHNLAVVGITETACKGCYNELPPQVINEVMKNSDILTCQACGRILYWEGD